MVIGVNLFDVGEEIEKAISHIENNNQHIIGIEMNEHTLDNINKKGIHGFVDAYGNMIPVILNDNLANNEVRFHREKNIKATEYEPYRGRI